MGQQTSWETLRVRVEDGICFIQLYRPEHNNTINDTLVNECLTVLEQHGPQCHVVVLQGLPEVFCFGADFAGLSVSAASGAQASSSQPEALYRLWSALATGPYVSVAQVRGKVNAGGVGFVAACDVVLADALATFSLSELLFGLFPACVLPFLIRRVGVAKAHYMTLMTQPVNVDTALAWGLVDACDRDAEGLLRKHLLRLRRLQKPAVARYKAYMNEMSPGLQDHASRAIAANKAIFSDPQTLGNISRFVESGKFPWEAA
jgi:polyketide biosynthesis enoyl-CoA hydratase PksH